MTTYYIDNRDVEIKCIVESGSMSISPTGTVYTDHDCTQQMNPVDPLSCNDQIEDNGDKDGKCQVSVSSNSSPSWTFKFQRKSGSTWGPDTDDLHVEVTDGQVEFRIHASQASTDIYSDPFIRVRHGYSSEAPVHVD